MVKLLEPQYANDVIQESKNALESSMKLKRKLISKNCDIVKRPLRNLNEFSNLKNQFVTLDHRNQMDNLTKVSPIRTSGNSRETRKRMYSSVESVHLPKINATKGANQPPPLRKSASYSTKQTRKSRSFLAIARMNHPNRMSSLRSQEQIGSVVKELDKISSILLPPGDADMNNMNHFNAKQNPYFISNEDEYAHQHNLGSMLKCYQQVSPNEFYKFMSEREMLSSQYSSVASTIVGDKHRTKDHSPKITIGDRREHGKKKPFPWDFF